MRRMMTSKQSDYVNGLSEVAEKGFKVGTYPAQIDIVNEGEFDWERLQESIEDEEIDFENHTFETLMMFRLPRLLEQYGLGENGDVGSISYFPDDAITMPNSVTDFESLKAWMQSEAFITALNTSGYSFDEYVLGNDVATYNGEDPGNNIILVNGELKLDTYVICVDGEGEEIIGASDPILEPTLKVKNLQVENVISENIAPWYLITGDFIDTDNNNYNIISGPTVKDNGKYSASVIVWSDEEPYFQSITTLRIDFENQSVQVGAVVKTLDSATIRLINALNGEVVELINI